MELKEVLDLLKVSKSWLYARMKEGKFPRPTKLSRKKVRWHLSDIDAYIAGCKRN